MQKVQELEGKLNNALETISTLSKSVEWMTKIIEKNVRDDELHRKLDDLLGRSDCKPDIVQLKNEGSLSFELKPGQLSVECGNNEINMIKKQLNLLIAGTQKQEEKVNLISERVEHISKCQQDGNRERKETAVLLRNMDEKMERLKEDIAEIPTKFQNLPEVRNTVDTVQTILGYVEHFSEANEKVEQTIEEMHEHVSTVLEKVSDTQKKKNTEFKAEFDKLEKNMNLLNTKLEKITAIEQSFDSFKQEMTDFEKEVKSKFERFTKSVSELDSQRTATEDDLNLKILKLENGKIETTAGLKVLEKRIDDMPEIFYCHYCSIVLRKCSSRDTSVLCRCCNKYNIVGTLVEGQKWMYIKCGWITGHFQLFPSFVNKGEIHKCKICNAEGAVSDANYMIALRK